MNDTNQCTVAANTSKPSLSEAEKDSPRDSSRACAAHVVMMSGHEVFAGIPKTTERRLARVSPASKHRANRTVVARLSTSKPGLREAEKENPRGSSRACVAHVVMMSGREVGGRLWSLVIYLLALAGVLRELVYSSTAGYAETDCRAALRNQCCSGLL